MNNPVGPINTILAALRRLVPEKEKLIIACSGGVDSMALLFCAQKTGHDLVVVHALHDMRDYKDASKDRDVVKKYCETNNLAFVQVDVNVRDWGFSPTEETYRYQRESKIIGVAQTHKARFIATGHHADDQLETILMKLCRGSGLRGLSGIAESHIHNDWTTVRPLLEISKEELYDICKSNNIPFNEDETNQDTKYTRNAIRHKVIPELKRLFPQCSQKSNEVAKIVTNAQKLSESVLHDLTKHETFFLAYTNTAPKKHGRALKIPTAALVTANDITIYEWLRRAFATVSDEPADVSYDSLSKEMIDSVIKGIRKVNISGGNKKFRWSSEVNIVVNKLEVIFSRLK